MTRAPGRMRLAAIGSGFVVVAVAALVAAGGRQSYIREYSSRIATQTQVAVLRPAQRICEGPVTSPGPTDGVAVWGGPVLPIATVSVDAQDATTRRALANGQFVARSAGEHVAALSTRIPAGRPLRICLHADLDSFSVLGTTRPIFSVTLLKRASLLSSIPLAFSRAALFHPSWVGGWTFWLLAVGLLGAFGLGVWAVAAASAEDTPPPPTDGAAS